jgi:hypothetical protein
MSSLSSASVPSVAMTVIGSDITSATGTSTSVAVSPRSDTTPSTRRPGPTTGNGVDRLGTGLVSPHLLERLADRQPGRQVDDHRGHAASDGVMRRPTEGDG